MRALSIALVVMFALIAAAGTEPAGSVEGKLTKVVGKVTVERDDAKIPAKAPMDVLGGDVIVTSAKSEAEIALDGGHVIKVAQNSHFTVDESPGGSNSGTTAMLYYGIVYARNPSPGAKTKPLEITTPTAVAGVRGTDFAVAVAPDGSAMFGVEDGEIVVETDDGSTAVTALEELTVDPDQPKPKKGRYDPKSGSIEAWKAAKLQKILANPLPALRRIGGTVNMLIQKTDECLANCKRLSSEALRIADAMAEHKKRGETDLYEKEKANLGPALKAFVLDARMLVRLDNRLASRIRLMNVILNEARAEGSPSPKRQVKIIERHIESLNALDVRARELHRGRRRIMRVVMPDVRRASAEAL